MGFKTVDTYLLISKQHFGETWFPSAETGDGKQTSLRFLRGDINADQRIVIFHHLCLFRIVGSMLLMRAVLFFFVCFYSFVNAFFDPDAALLNASEHGNVEGIKEALGRGAHMLTRNNFATTPLIFAANNGHLDAVRYLLDVNADIEAYSNNGRTPLIWACYWGHAEVVKFLIARGANIDAADFGMGYTLYVSRMLFPSIFHVSIQFLCFCHAMLIADFILTRTEIDGLTTVMSAAFSGNAEIVEFLMEQGASVSAVNSFNGTAYSIAKIKNHTEVVLLLAPHYSPTQDLNPYRIALDLMYNGLVRRIRYFTYKVRYYTGLAPFELNEEL